MNMIDPPLVVLKQSSAAIYRSNLDFPSPASPCCPLVTVL